VRLPAGPEGLYSELTSEVKAGHVADTDASDLKALLEERAEELKAADGAGGVVNEQMTPNSVALALAQLGRDLDATVKSLDVADRQAVTAREDFTVAYARAFLKADGAMDVRRYQATVDTHTERLAAEAAEQVVRGLRRQVESIKVRVDIGRSYGSALKAELTALGGAA
jgi:hypothetical protein